MTGSIEQKTEAYSKIFGTGSVLAIASHGIRIWNAKAFYLEKDFTVYCATNDVQTLANIRKSPRVAFSTGSEESGSSLQGNGIAHLLDENSGNLSPEDGINLQKLQQITGFRKFEFLKIVPYRLTVTGNDQMSPGVTIEKRKLEWIPLEAPSDAVPAESGSKLMSWLRFWSKAARSISFPLAIFPVIIGSMAALMKGSFDLALFILSLVGGVIIHAGVNLISDYHDFKKGVDTTDALSSHTGILVNETVEPEHILKGALISFMLATLIAGILIAKVGWPILIFAVFGAAGGYSYTGGPVSYKYIGLGELLITLLMGPLMVLGAYYVQMQRLDFFPLLISLPVGLLVGSVTLSNNLRDILYDRMVNIETLPMKLGIRKAKIMYYAMILAPYLIILALVLANLSLYPVMLVLLSLPMAVRAMKAIRSTEDSAEDIQAKARQLKYPLNSIKVHFQFCLLLSAGCLILAALG